MNELILNSLSKLTGLSTDDLTAKLESTPEEVASKLDSVKLFSPEIGEEYFNNRMSNLTVSDFNRLAPDGMKADLHKSTVINAFEKKEKDIQDKHGTAFKRGVDYTTTEQLLELIYKQENKGGEQQDGLVEQLQAKLLTKDKEREDALEEQRNQFEQRIYGTIKQNALSGIKSKMAEPDKHLEQLEFVQHKFDKAYDLKETDKGLQVINRTTGQVELDDNGQAKSVDTVMFGIAQNIVPIQKTVPVGGRGVNNEPPKIDDSKAKYLKYATVEEFEKQGLTDMGIEFGTSEHFKALAEYDKAQAE